MWVKVWGCWHLVYILYWAKLIRIYSAVPLWTLIIRERVCTPRMCVWVCQCYNPRYECHYLSRLLGVNSKLDCVLSDTLQDWWCTVIAHYVEFDIVSMVYLCFVLPHDRKSAMHTRDYSCTKIVVHTNIASSRLIELQSSWNLAIAWNSHCSTTVLAVYTLYCLQTPAFIALYCVWS